MRPPDLDILKDDRIETDDLPHSDGSFDVVVCSQLIEHLGCNPVRTLSEIHRVRKPGGAVVVTTPNALSLERVATFVRGGSQMVERYSPLFGYGARLAPARTARRRREHAAVDPRRRAGFPEDAGGRHRRRARGIRRGGARRA